MIDESPRMLLIEADPDTLSGLVDELPGWVMTPDQSYPVPDNRERIKRPPD